VQSAVLVADQSTSPLLVCYQPLHAGLFLALYRRRRSPQAAKTVSTARTLRLSLDVAAAASGLAAKGEVPSGREWFVAG